MTLQQIVAAALAEDIGPGDVTTRVAVPDTARGRGVFLAKAEGVVAGMQAARECFRQVDPEVRFTELMLDGQAFHHGDELASVEGRAQSLLTAERVALNFLQRLSGVATLTRAFVSRTAGARGRIVDTRKTTPGLRLLEKAAVRAGGAANHRFALYDGILLKDNHIALAGGVSQAVQRARAAGPHTLKVEVEVTSLEQLNEALAAGADIVLLDNMSTQEMQQAVRQVAGKVLLEASGGVNLDTVADIAATGVDLISVGALTHSAPAADISLEIVPIEDQQG